MLRDKSKAQSSENSVHPDEGQPAGQRQAAAVLDPGTVQIKVFGVGGAGVNAVRRMGAAKTVPGVELLALNTDAASLEQAAGVKHLALGSQTTQGMGAGGNPEVGRKAAEESLEAIRAEMTGVDLAFITAGLGGGTGTGAAPIVSAMAREAGALTVGIVTTPFQFEGTRRRTAAFRGLAALRGSVDTLIVVNNQHLAATTQRGTPIQAAFRRVDDVVSKAVLTVSSIINIPGDVNVDFADVRAVMKDGGLGLIGMGSGTGDRRLLDAARAALAQPLVNGTVQGAGGILFFISAASDIRLSEVAEAGAYLSGLASPEAQMFFGLHTKPGTAMAASSVEVMLIATRLSSEASGLPPPADQEQAIRATVPIYEAHDEGPPFHVPPM
jgi:cell division protein FtsZ